MKIKTRFLAYLCLAIMLVFISGCFSTPRSYGLTICALSNKNMRKPI